MTLSGFAPPITRELVVDRALPLDRLHDAIVAAFGWTRADRHVFLDADDLPPGIVFDDSSEVDLHDFERRRDNGRAPKLSSRRRCSVSSPAPRSSRM